MSLYWHIIGLNFKLHTVHWKMRCVLVEKQWVAGRGYLTMMISFITTSRRNGVAKLGALGVKSSTVYYIKKYLYRILDHVATVSDCKLLLQLFH